MGKAIMAPAAYREIRDLLSTGDLVAFSGQGPISKLISWATGGPVSHVGLVVQGGTDVNLIMESTSLDGGNGVSLKLLSERIQEYDGPVWILRLDPDYRRRLDLDRFRRFLYSQHGKRYDAMQAVMSAIDLFGQDDLGFLTRNREDFSRLFCSELVAGAYQAAGMIGIIRPASEVTPMDIIRWDLWQSTYYAVRHLDPCNPAQLRTLGTQRVS